jgi:3-hydroxyisobutyrate dehydrogenase
MRVAAIGIGLMGAAMARRLNETGGFDTVLWNRTRARADELGIGLVADTPAAATAGADLVVTSLLNPAAMRIVFAGPDGILEAADRQVILETSTGGPGTLLELADLLSTSGSSLVDSPFLGSTGAVLSNTLGIILGGAPADIERAWPVITALGKARRVGGVGQAAQLKLIHNTVLAVVSAMTAEMLVAADTAEIDREEAFTMVSRISPYMKNREGGYLRGEFNSVSFAMTGVALWQTRWQLAATPHSVQRQLPRMG